MQHVGVGQQYARVTAQRGPIGLRRVAVVRRDEGAEERGGARVAERAQGAQLRTGARELSAAAAHLVRDAQRAADAGEESAADAQAAASAAAAAAREVLMQVAVRLEAAVGDACVPPIALTAGDAAAEAAERQLWRALKLVELIGAWRDQLADGALRELAAALLAQHALPYLRAQLAAAPPRWELVVGGVEAAARALPDAWRMGGGGRTASCAALLGRFVADELAPAVAAAGGGAPEGAATRVAALSRELG